MLRLPPGLDALCLETLLPCGEFNSYAALQAVFITTELAPFRDDLPNSVDSKHDRVAQAIQFLLENHLADGRPLILPFVQALIGRHPTDDLRRAKLEELFTRLEQENDRPASRPATEAPFPESVEKNRRVDAAAPAQVFWGRHFDLVVQVRFPNSSALGLQDWPTRVIPPTISQQSQPAALNFPRDPQTGALAPSPLLFRVSAPNCTIEGSAEQWIEVPPDKYSQKILFLLTAREVGDCRIQIEVSDANQRRIGIIPVETNVGKKDFPEAAQTANVAQLILVVTAREAQGRRSAPPFTRPERVSAAAGMKLLPAAAGVLLLVLLGGMLLKSPLWALIVPGRPTQIAAVSHTPAALGATPPEATATLPPTSTALPSSTVIPTATAVPACLYAGEAQTDEQVFRFLIDAEARVVNNRDLQLAGRVFAPDAIFRDMASPASIWYSSTLYYQAAVFDSQVRAARHVTISVFSGATPLVAYATSASSGQFGDAGTYNNSAGSDHWVFGRKSLAECWVITRFDFNAAGFTAFPP